LPVGTQGQEPASPMNGMIRYSTTANDVEAYIAGAWTTLTTGGSTAAITLGTSAATPNPASSYSATTGLFSGASGQVSVTSTGSEIARFTGTGVSIGTTYVSTAAPTNGLLVRGNVGIGTTSPPRKLTIRATSGNTQPFLIATNDYNNSNVGSLFTVEFGASSGNTYTTLNGLSAGCTAWNNLILQYGGGNVGIGTTAPAYLLHVGSPTAVGVVADFQNSSDYCTFSPSANGILTTCTSDVRLKKDIVDAGDALAWLGTMRIRDFTLKATGERRTGVIAQEMMKVHPEMVRMGATGFYQVDVPDAWKLIKAIQELKAENDNLVTRIGAEDDALNAANDNIADLRASFEAYKAAHP
jgi:uncharacterized protein YaiE (UPF0345 family)